jgi:membrane protein DedA with SNARE-associated domain
MIAQLHALNVWASYCLALPGILFGEVFWYCIGCKLGSKFSRHSRTTFVIQRVKKSLLNSENKPFYVIFCQRILSGMNDSTLVVLGFFLKFPSGILYASN